MEEREIDQRLDLRVGGVECIVDPTLLLGGLGHAAGQTVRRLHIPRSVHLITSINSGTDRSIFICLMRIRIICTKLPNLNLSFEKFIF